MFIVTSYIPDADTNTFEEFLVSLNKNAATDPDQLYCRLINPGKLEPNTAYFAFLIPAFETGRPSGARRIRRKDWSDACPISFVERGRRQW